MQTSRLEIDLMQLDANLTAIRQYVGPHTHVCGVVKADAYGLGAVAIANRLANGGVDMLAVYSSDQAQELAEHDIDCPIFILMPVRTIGRGSALWRMATRDNVHLTVQAPDHLEQINRIGQSLGRRLPVHLHMDTGMSRAGLTPDQLDTAVACFEKFTAIRIAGICTHFAAAENDPAFTAEQMQRFENALNRSRRMLPDDLIVHVANTFATCRDRRYHQSMVRVGLGLYGYGPQLICSPAKGSDELAVRPIVRWVSRIVHVQRYNRGAYVGYNRTRQLTRPSILGVVPVGYGDGYPLALSNQSCVRLMVDAATACITAPVLGQVNMDQIVVDLTDHPLPVGAEVELISNDDHAPHALHKLAAMAQSSCYEMFCRLSPKLPRRYL